MRYFLALVLCVASFSGMPRLECERYAYATITLRIPVGVDGRDVVRMIDNMPFEGVYVIDAQDLPGPPKNPRRPNYLPKLQPNGSK